MRLLLMDGPSMPASNPLSFQEDLQESNHTAQVGPVRAMAEMAFHGWMAWSPSLCCHLLPQSHCPLLIFFSIIGFLGSFVFFFNCVCVCACVCTHACACVCVSLFTSVWMGAHTL